MDGAGIVDQKRAGRTGLVDRKPALQEVPVGRNYFFRNIPVDAYQFVGIEGEVLLVRAAVAAAGATKSAAPDRVSARRWLGPPARHRAIR